MRRVVLLLTILMGIGIAGPHLHAEDSVEIQRGQQLVIWPLGETTADQVFRSVTVACQRQTNQNWLCYIPEHRATNFTIRQGDVLWISSPLAQTIRLGGAPQTESANAGCNFTDATTAVFASTFQVITDSGSGTAFYIGDGEFLTAAHVVNGGGRIQLRTQEQRIAATLVGLDGHSDLALLRADDANLSALPFADHDALRPGQTLGVAGFPGVAESFASRPGRPSVASGVLSKIVERDGVTYIQTNAETNPGNSGGAVFTACGEVVGVVHGGFEEDGGRRIEGINYAVALPTIWEQLPHLRAGHMDSAAAFQADPKPAVTALCNSQWDGDIGAYVDYETVDACRVAGLDGFDPWEPGHIFWNVDREAEEFFFWIPEVGPFAWDAFSETFNQLAPGEHQISLALPDPVTGAIEQEDWGEPYTFTIRLTIWFSICEAGPGDESLRSCYAAGQQGINRSAGLSYWGHILNWGQEWYLLNGGDPLTPDQFFQRFRRLSSGQHTVRVGEYRSWGWTGWSPSYTFTIR